MRTNDRSFYIAAMSETPEGGIYQYRLNAQGKPEQLSFAPLAGANYMAFSADGKTLYSTGNCQQKGSAAAFRIRPDGSLEFLNAIPSEGVSTCYIIPSPGGKYLYCANYMNSCISEFSLNPDGSLRARERVIAYQGHGPHPRQTVPHPHFTNITPDGRFLAVIDLGLDAITLYGLDGDGRIELEKPSVFRVTPGGSGPRHLVFNRKGDIAYLCNEVGNTAAVLDYRDGEFRQRQLLSTLPEGCTAETKAAAIRLSPDERFLYVSNRGFDSVAVFRVDPQDGALTLQEIVPSEGVSPRDIAFLPDGRHFACANEFSDLVAFFDFDPASGKLTPNGHRITLPRPLAICW